MGVYVLIDNGRDGCLQNTVYYRTAERADLEAERCRQIKGCSFGSIEVVCLIEVEPKLREYPSTFPEMIAEIDGLYAGMLFGDCADIFMPPQAEQHYIKAKAFLEIAKCELQQSDYCRMQGL